MERVICVLIGYAFGLFQTGFLYGKSQKIDIRNYGSGNSGTTNALRTLGWKAGVITFIGDCFKCIFAVVLVNIIYRNSMQGALPLLGLYAGMGAVLGHNYPFYLNFRGGKGVATSVGLAFSTNIWVALAAIATFYVIMRITRYVSAGSIALLGVFFAGIVIYGETVGFALAETSMQYEMYGIAGFLFLLSVWRHKENIKRIINGTENKTKSKKKS